MNENNHIKLEIACTGLTKEDIEVSAEGNSIRIKGTSKDVSDSKEWRLINGKLKRKSFEKVISLSGRLDYAKAEAEVVNGLLTITIPPKVSAEKKNISIK